MVLILFLDPVFSAVNHGAEVTRLGAVSHGSEVECAGSQAAWSRADVARAPRLASWMLAWSSGNRCYFLVFAPININCASMVALDGYMTRCLSL